MVVEQRKELLPKSACVYHEDKIEFEAVRKDLTRAKILPRKLSSRLAMAVCSCRRSRQAEMMSLCSDDKPVIKLLVSEEMAHWRWDETKRRMCDMVDRILKSPDAPGSSQDRLLQVLYLAILGDYSLLECETDKRKDDRSRVTEKHKCGAAQVAHIVRRKKARFKLRSKIVLPVFGGEMRKLEKMAEIGTGFSRLCHRFDCVLEVDRTTTQKDMDANVKKLTLNIWCRKDLEKTCRLVRTALEEIITQNNAQLTKAPQQRKRSRRVFYPKYDDFQSDEVDDFKTIMTVGFENKNFFDKKHKKKQRRIKSGGCDDACSRKTRLPSVLDCGHCLNCFMPYPGSVHHKDTTCRHHPGYIDSNKEWSCCHVAVGSPLNTHDEHKFYGCSEGQHCWRRGSRSCSMSYIPQSPRDVARQMEIYLEC